MDFWLVLSKNDSNIICSSIKNESFLKIWRVWHILKVCHALWYLKIEMGIAGSIFELHPPNFQKMCIFWRFTNDISTIFCYLLWFQFWKKCQSLPVHPRVVPVLFHTFFAFTRYRAASGGPRLPFGFEDAQMILVPYFTISIGFNFEKNAKAFQSILQ